ncbi:MAG: gamma-glutamyltransferase [Betaproteobacteria bacterium]|nr:gamma-glutamyltransferase [Betaproteobacteria bacterium]MDH5577204.1 gamma-glutamyltransferase [Betaproteobacteria bacterium]
MAVSHPLAAEAGARMLRNGGNAIDAAAAIQFALNVVEPEFSGIGGGGFMLVHLAKGKGKTFVIEGREKAPASADTTLFTNPDGSNQSFTAASTSGQAVGVPGTLMVVATAVKRHGRKRLAEVMQPAIELAENGFPVNFVLAGNVTSSRTNLYQATRDVFRPGGVPLQLGQILVQPDLAKTLRLIAAQGPKVFYRGEIAAAIVEAQKGTANGGKPGLMTLEDLKNYDIVIREPTLGEYRGYRIAAMSPPSSGGLTMIQALKMIERFPIGDAAAGFGFGKANTLHVMAEAMRIVWADRAVWMGDEDFVDVPKRGLLHRDYVRERGDLISLTARIPGIVPFGDPWLYESKKYAGRTVLAAAQPLSHPGGYTTHFSVVDQWGNVVSYTTTIEAGWGTGITVPGYGFLLNNELTDFNFGFNMHPRFGGPAANDVQGGKRPRSSMTPTILFKGDQPIAAFGSPGGATIINSVYNVLINLVDHGMTLKDAIEAPRISVTTAGNSISREAGFDEAEIAKLRALGHTVNNPGNIGNVNGIFIDLRTGKQYGAVDSTREGGLIGLPKAPGKGGDDDDDDD